MAYAFLIDTTLCTACRGCQVACKQWHDLPAEKTTNRGSFQNPQDLSFGTYKLVRMREKMIDKRVQWLFFPDQCRHCIEAPCLETAGDPAAIYQDGDTGAILYTAETQHLETTEIIEACPYYIPRAADDGTLAKCDMCNDRVHNGLKPACVQTCPTGAMQFGERDEILNLADQHLQMAKKRYPQASLLDPDDVSVIYLVGYPPDFYHAFAVAAAGRNGMTRHLALRKIVRPLVQLGSRLL
jgi:formate dehydrogenase iron-sulfur subunit